MFFFLSHSIPLNYLIFHFIVYIENPLIYQQCTHTTRSHITQKAGFRLFRSVFGKGKKCKKIETEAISQKWKMNFGKSDALNSGDCCWLYYSEERNALEGNKTVQAKQNFIFLFVEGRAEKAAKRKISNEKLFLNGKAYMKLCSFTSHGTG